MHITLGSRSLVKVAAVREACGRFFGKEGFLLSEVETSSGQYEQPVGMEETYAGALNRAIAAKQANPAAIAIGIENGIVFIRDNFVVDIAVIVISTPDNVTIVSTSAGVQLQMSYVQEAKQRGFKTTTVGAVMAEHLGCESSDLHSSITGGVVSRKRLLIDAVTVALSQL